MTPVKVHLRQRREIATSHLKEVDPLTLVFRNPEGLTAPKIRERLKFPRPPVLRMQGTVFEREGYGNVMRSGNREVRTHSATAAFSRGKAGPDFVPGALDHPGINYLGNHGDAWAWPTDNSVAQHLDEVLHHWYHYTGIGTSSPRLARPSINCSCCTTQSIRSPAPCSRTRHRHGTGGAVTIRL